MNLKIKRGLLAGVANLVVGMGFNQLAGIAFPTLALEYQNPLLFRPWSDPLMTLFFASPFILGLVLSYFWEMIEGRFKGNAVARASQFAKLYFVIATVPGMFITYTSFQISALMVLAWSATGLAEAFVAGWVFGKVKK